MSPSERVSLPPGFICMPVSLINSLKSSLNSQFSVIETRTLTSLLFRTFGGGRRLRGVFLSKNYLNYTGTLKERANKSSIIVRVNSVRLIDSQVQSSN